MQFSTLFTAATVFALTLASPVEIVARQNTAACGQSQTSSCCDQTQSNDPTNTNQGIGNILSSIGLNTGVNCAVMSTSCPCLLKGSW